MRQMIIALLLLVSVAACRETDSSDQRQDQSIPGTTQPAPPTAQEDGSPPDGADVAVPEPHQVALIMLGVAIATMVMFPKQRSVR